MKVTNYYDDVILEVLERNLVSRTDFYDILKSRYIEPEIKQFAEVFQKDYPRVDMLDIIDFIEGEWYWFDYSFVKTYNKWVVFYLNETIQRDIPLDGCFLDCYDQFVMQIHDEITEVHNKIYDKVVDYCKNYGRVDDE